MKVKSIFRNNYYLTNKDDVLNYYKIAFEEKRVKSTSSGKKFLKKATISQLKKIRSSKLSVHVKSN